MLSLTIFKHPCLNCGEHLCVRLVVPCCTRCQWTAGWRHTGLQFQPQTLYLVSAWPCRSGNQRVKITKLWLIYISICFHTTSSCAHTVSSLLKHPIILYALCLVWGCCLWTSLKLLNDIKCAKYKNEELMCFSFFREMHLLILSKPCRCY